MELIIIPLEFQGQATKHQLCEMFSLLEESVDLILGQGKELFIRTLLWEYLRKGKQRICLAFQGESKGARHNMSCSLAEYQG